MRPGRARMYAENDDVIYVSSFGEKSHTKSRHMAAISSLSWSEINLLFSHKLGRRFRGFFLLLKIQQQQLLRIFSHLTTTDT